jgi:4-diphosphocytidyl-2-C-methyl-D-erythritol kinase
MTPITVEASAKVNLFLRVLGRETEGYHSIETLFVRTRLADRLTAERRDQRGVGLTVEGADTGPEADNLAYRAAELVLGTMRADFGVALHLEKRIPVGAGLGGGSADAAAALQAVNALAGNPIPRHELFQLAARLGSDVPFCFSGAALALGWGRGERLMILPPLPPAPLLLLSPPVSIRTAEAYAWVAESRQQAGRRGAVALDLEALGSWGSIGRMSGNDFEVPVFGRHPEIRAAYEAVAGTHPLLCRMSGSGSTVYGLYRNTRDRDDAAMQLGRKHGRVIATETG